MKFNQHLELRDKHAVLSASRHHWVNYTPERLLEYYDNLDAAVLGTRLHAFAHEAIALGIKMPNNSKTLNMYVNDCIGFRMQNEVPLVYSEYAFGTADAIDFRREFEGAMTLRIFDLKTGVKPTSDMQLLIYAAYFCLEYKVKPLDLIYDLRIYQDDNIKHIDVDPEAVEFIKDRAIESDKIIRNRLIN